MRLLVISDTHGVLRSVFNILDDIGDELYAVIHLGDIFEDVERIRSKYPSLKVYNVKGNCDYGTSAQTEQILNVGGKTIFMTHGHKLGVNMSRDSLAYKGLEVGADICLYGHTHVPLVEHIGKVTVMNPGSLSSPRGGSRPTYGIINIENGTMSTALVEFKEY
jgi:hypothetical protein